MTSIIRPAEQQDAPQLWTLVQQFPTPSPPDEKAFSSAFDSMLLDPSSLVAVAIVDLAMVGYVSGYRHSTFYASGSTAWVDELYVHPDYRRRGLGRRLMYEFERWAWSHECKLSGLATNGARDFYEQLGYVSKAGYYKKYAGSEV